MRLLFIKIVVQTMFLPYSKPYRDPPCPQSKTLTPYPVVQPWPLSGLHSRPPALCSSHTLIWVPGFPPWRLCTCSSLCLVHLLLAASLTPTAQLKCQLPLDTPACPYMPLSFFPTFSCAPSSQKPPMSGSSDLSLLCPQGPGQCEAGTWTWEYAHVALPVLTTRGRLWVRNKCLGTTLPGPSPQGEVGQTGHRRKGSGPL